MSKQGIADWAYGVMLDWTTLTRTNAAIAFTYFEALQRSGNRDRILAEQTRLKSLNNLLSRVGFQPHLYEDFVDETITLLAQLATIAPRRAEAAALVEGRFNDGAASSAIITHLRVSWPWSTLVGDEDTVD